MAEEVYIEQYLQAGDRRIVSTRACSHMEGGICGCGAAKGCLYMFV